ncbi:unnamed protein product [Caenorhabditis auriculariae]|uniref:Delta(24)-sterol reductase n=1 Tax=Caenorhabditis auriculariae TaxID=2777116 RepID=A0A8S1GQD7_9PELO|nr:unnamed protein product [Caenorhabditis auriculariae]
MSAKEPSALNAFERQVEWIMFRFRWIFVILFLLPASLIFDSYHFVRNYFIYKLQSAPRAHGRKVARIKRQVREWNESGKKTKMCTARSGWSTMSFRFPLYKKNMTQINTDQLVDILEIDEKALTVRVEPMVTMGQITRFLLPLGYTLPIVPELDDLTVGGMINGCGVEASGRKYGMFQHICVAYELVMADGSLVTAKKFKNPSTQEETDMHTLFFGIPWSHGTLGFLVSATLRIIPCRPFVKLTYYPTKTLEEMEATLREEAENRENEFVEGLLFSKDRGVVMRGRFSDGPIDNTGKINSIGRWYKKWFYTHVEDLTKTGKVHTEFIPLREYYHRHSKSIFWELKEIVPFGNNVVFRWLLGWMCPPKISLLKLTTPPTLRKLYDRKHVLQDMLVPLDRLNETINVFHKEVEVYPIWLCPFNQPSCPGMVRQRSGKSIMYVDVGVYGITEKKKIMTHTKGFQMMYADTYMTRSEFWEMFDSSIYDWLRTKYQCTQAFPDVYDKVCKAARY